MNRKGKDFEKVDFLAVGKARRAIFRPTSGLGEGSFDSSCFSVLGTWYISPPAGEQQIS